MARAVLVGSQDRLRDVMNLIDRTTSWSTALYNTAPEAATFVKENRAAMIVFDTELPDEDHAIVKDALGEERMRTVQFIVLDPTNLSSVERLIDKLKEKGG